MIDKNKFTPTVDIQTPFDSEQKIKLKPNLKVVPAPKKVPKNLSKPTTTSLGSSSGATSGVTIQGRNASFRDMLGYFEKLSELVDPVELNKISANILELWGLKKGTL